MFIKITGSDFKESRNENLQRCSRHKVACLEVRQKPNFPFPFDVELPLVKTHRSRKNGANFLALLTSFGLHSQADKKSPTENNRSGCFGEFSWLSINDSDKQKK